MSNVTRLHIYIIIYKLLFLKLWSGLFPIISIEMKINKEVFLFAPHYCNEDFFNSESDIIVITLFFLAMYGTIRFLPSHAAHLISLIS